MADTRGPDQDECHKANIATQFEEHIDFVTAVLIIANGTVARLNTGTDYALTTLSALFPKTLVTNMAFVFTNIPNPLSCNFAQEAVSEMVEDALQLFLDNPCALQKKHSELEKANKTKRLRNMREFMENSEKEALVMLVELFDWLDGLTPQPTKEIVNLYELSQQIESAITNALAQIDQAAAKKDEINGLIANPKVSSSPSRT